MLKSNNQMYFELQLRVFSKHCKYQDHDSRHRKGLITNAFLKTVSERVWEGVFWPKVEAFMDLFGKRRATSNL